MMQAIPILPQPAAPAVHPADGTPRCPRCHQPTLDYSSELSLVRCQTCALWMRFTPAQNDDYSCILTGIDLATDPSLFLTALVALTLPEQQAPGLGVLTMEPLLAVSPPDLSFGALLKAHRFSLDLTQQALADAVYVSRELIAAIETGRARPRPELAEALAAYLALAGPERAAFLRCARAWTRSAGPAQIPPPPPPLVLCILSASEAPQARPLLCHPEVRGGAATRYGPDPAGGLGGEWGYPRVVLVSLAVLLDSTRLLPAIADALRTAR